MSRQNCPSASTRNWPVFSLRDYSVAAKSACILIQKDDAQFREPGGTALPHGGLRMRVAGLAALTAA